MVVDTAAYRLLHRAGTGAPCLSLDIIKDDLGDDRESLPLSLLLCAGTQANTAQGNRLMVLKMLNLHGPRRGAGSGADSDSEDEDDEDEDDEERSPRLHLAMIPHYGTINRVRVADLPPGPIAAVWSERGSVELYELGPALGVLEEEEGGGDGTPNLRQLKEQKPTFSFGGHQDEGYAMDWSPTVPGRLLSGDNGGRIHQWEPREGGTWDVKPRPFRGHTAAVEDVQWAPREAPVFVSCSCDSSVRIWDIRAPPGGGASRDQRRGRRSRQGLGPESVPDGPQRRHVEVPQRPHNIPPMVPHRKGGVGSLWGRRRLDPMGFGVGKRPRSRYRGYGGG